MSLGTRSPASWTAHLDSPSPPKVTCLFLRDPENYVVTFHGLAGQVHLRKLPVRGNAPPPQEW